MSARDDEALVRRAVEAIWNRCELDVADELFAPDYVNHDGIIPDLIHGPEAIKISVVLYRRAFPDLHLTVDQLSSEGETVLMHWTARRRSPRENSDPTADRGLLTGITRSHLVGGKIKESWTEWNAVPWLRALWPPLD
jgi:hypothetical protein